MGTAKTASMVLGLALVLIASGCRSAGEIEPPASPRRPKPVKTKKNVTSVKKDCRPTDPTTLPSSWTYKDRSIEESQNLARDGVELLQESADTKLPKIDREDRFMDAVDRLIKALKADPYNVHATYNLAAAYARIGRGQCAVNLLARLVELRKLASQKDEVERHLDRLLGRGKRELDPDFLDLRDDRAFRDVVRKF